MGETHGIMKLNWWSNQGLWGHKPWRWAVADKSKNIITTIKNKSL